LLHLITLNDTHTHTHTLGRTPLDKGLACHRELYLTIHNIHKRQTSTAGLKPDIPASKHPQTHTLDCSATRIIRVLEKANIWQIWGFYSGGVAEDTESSGMWPLGKNYSHSDRGHIPADFNLQVEWLLQSSRILPSFYQTQNFIVVFTTPYCDHVQSQIHYTLCTLLVLSNE
jgi:hypothetical protein